MCKGQYDSTTIYDKLIVNNVWSEEDGVTVENVIDTQVYEALENYSDMCNFDEIVDIVIEHLDDEVPPGLYGLQVGKDYSREKVEEITRKYWDMYNHMED